MILKELTSFVNNILVTSRGFFYHFIIIFYFHFFNFSKKIIFVDFNQRLIKLCLEIDFYSALSL